MADEFLRVGGRGIDGTAKALKTDNDGRILQRGESEVIVFSKDNPLPPRIASDFEPRVTKDKGHSFPHMWTPYPQPPFSNKSYRNIFDQTFTIFSTLDVEVKVTFYVIEHTASPDMWVEIMSINVGTLPAKTRYMPSMMILTPEKTTMSAGISTVVELPELRQPYPAFRINIQPLEVPTIGEIKIMNTRRY